MREQDRVDVFEATVPREPRLCCDQLLGNAGPDHDGPGQVLTFHDLLDGQRCGDIYSLPGVVALTVPRGAFDHRLAIGDTRHLRRFWNAVYIRAERNNWFTLAPRRPPGRGDAGDTLLYGETVLHQNLCQVTLSFKLLEAQF